MFLRRMFLVVLLFSFLLALPAERSRRQEVSLRVEPSERSPTGAVRPFPQRMTGNPPRKGFGNLLTEPSEGSQMVFVGLGDRKASVEG